MIYAHLTVAMIYNRFTADDIQCFALMRYGRANDYIYNLLYAFGGVGTLWLQSVPTYLSYSNSHLKSIELGVFCEMLEHYKRLGCRGVSDLNAAACGFI